MIGINCLRSSKPPLIIGSSGRWSRLRSAKEGVDDLDKPASLVVGATPRRSTSS